MTETEGILKQGEATSAPATSGPDDAAERLVAKYQEESLAVDDGGEELLMLQQVQLNFPESIVEPSPELISGIEAIPEKMAFKIGEAAEMVGVKQYVLRYWESEFEMLRPRKSKNNQRVYSRRDVETAMMIKKLLYDDRFSIEGARAALRHLKNQVKEDRGIKRMVENHESALSSALTKLNEMVTDIRRLREVFTA